MRIENLSFQNFKSFENLEINLSTTTNAVVFIGENGCGKTSVLLGIEKLLGVLTREIGVGSLPRISLQEVNLGKKESECQIYLKGSFNQETYEYDLKPNKNRRLFLVLYSIEGIQLKVYPF